MSRPPVDAAAQAVERVRALRVLESAEPPHRSKCVPIEDLELLCAAADENVRLRARLTDRGVIDRAKAVLMEKRELTEDAAYHLMRRVAMREGKRLVEVARRVVDVPSVALGLAGPR